MPALARALAPGIDLDLRPATADDARLYAELTLAHRPDEPADPEVAEHDWAHPTPGWSRERFIVELRGRPAGFVMHLDSPAEVDPERTSQIEAFLVPAVTTLPRLRALHAFIEERARSAGARVLTTDVWEDETAHAELLESIGYQRDRFSKAWELDLVENRDRLLMMAARTEISMREQGITCLAVADDPDSDIWRRAHQAEFAAAEDIPHSGFLHRPGYDEFMVGNASPDSTPRWYFVAKHADRVVGVSSLRFPPVRGNVWTAFTGVVPEYRGRGIARAVKLAIMRQAIEQAVPRARTDNDDTNAPMLHINEQLGYQRIPGIVSYRKAP